MTELNDYAFSFAFRPGQSHKDLGRNNIAKIYSIVVTNIAGNQGGADSCQSCPRGVQDNGSDIVHSYILQNIQSVI